MSGQDFVLVLEDLRDWDNADHLAGLTLDRARLCIGQLAGLHAWSMTVDPALLQQFPSIDSALTRDLFLPAFAPGWQLYREHTEQPVPAAVARFAERFADVAPPALTALAERNMLLHGDIRADNMFFRGAELKLVDFQLTVRGAGAADIGYLVSQGLPTGAPRAR
jgi:Ser/Thr protein kinase RdoA (MazF antagonist)